MKYQKITIEVPALTDEAAAYLHKFIEALMYAVDEYYYRRNYSPLLPATRLTGVNDAAQSRK